VLYEIDDPARYRLPDVVCDFTGVAIVQDGEDRVRVSGARGRPAPPTLKVCGTWSDGWRLVGTLMIGGHEAAPKAARVGESILARCARLMGARGWPAFTETSIEVLGSEATYGPHARALATREVVLKVAAKHPGREALELLAREIAPSATSMAQGITGFAAGRPSPSPVVRLFSFLAPRSVVRERVELDGRDIGFEPAPVGDAGVDDDGRASDAAAPDAGGPAEAAASAGPPVRVPLLRIAHGRSGDKGDTSNIGIVARCDAAYTALPQGKAFAQMLLDLEVDVPASVLETSE
jgi:hypothetical protein